MWQRRARIAGMMACMMAWSVSVQAKQTPDQALAKAGLERPTACQALGAPGALAARQKAWAKGVAALAKSHPKYLLRWVVGAAEPPKLVLRETQFQRDCLLRAMMKDAGDPKTKLVLDYGDGTKTKKAMADWARRVKKSPKWRGRAIAWFTRSHHRNASAQAGIWWRKYSFSPPRSFNAISKRAGAKCRLTPGQTWKPSNRVHRTCWKKKLTADERQQEILRASSAPGLSRHHWGTDIDVFGLNPRLFLPKKKLSDEYAWMRKNALSHGFFQTYVGPKRLGRESYMEERWHWSYYPIGQALHDWSKANQGKVKGALFGQWDRFERRWGRHKVSPFSYVRKRWSSYFFGVAPVQVSQAPVPWASPLGMATLVAML